MSRSRPRTSRVLLVVLALAVCVGVITFARRHSQNRASAVAANAAAAPQAPAAVAAVADDVDAVITAAPAASTGGVKPATAARGATASKPQAPSPVTVVSSKSLAEAKAQADAGKLVEARDIYNAALISGKLSPAEADATKQELAALNDTLVFSPRRIEADPWGGTFTVPSGGVLAKIAKRFDITPALLARINDISDPRRLQAGQSIKVIKGPIHAVVDKSAFTLDLYLGAPGGPGSAYLTTYSVGLGKDDSTPTGKWLCEPNKKLANPTYYSSRGEGVIAADDPKNPLGEFWIGLSGIDGQAVGKTSYGIHGTIEPESIGTMASQGCIRLKNEDVAHVFEMLIEGKSTVVVQD